MAIVNSDTWFGRWYCRLGLIIVNSRYVCRFTRRNERNLILLAFSKKKKEKIEYTVTKLSSQYKPIEFVQIVVSLTNSKLVNTYVPVYDQLYFYLPYWMLVCVASVLHLHIFVTDA